MPPGRPVVARCCAKRAVTCANESCTVVIPTRRFAPVLDLLRTVCGLVDLRGPVDQRRRP